MPRYKKTAVIRNRVVTRCQRQGVNLHPGNAATQVIYQSGSSAAVQRNIAAMPVTELLEAERPKPGEGKCDAEINEWTTRRLETGENVLAREQSAHVQPPAIAGRIDGQR